jgi:ubiquinone/menaquinone biosynthesis C-methylase UbiE
MAEPIRFQNGAQYDEFMGQWSRFAGELFLQWLAPARDLKWADIGCGNGAFTQMLIEHVAAASIDGVDPSPEQIEFARSSSAGQIAHFQQGNAMALPFANASFDAAVMALVLFFVPDPAKGVAEMCRVVRPGGSVSAYTWDILEGGFPYDALFDGLNTYGIEPMLPPSSPASRMEATLDLWNSAGLQDIETKVISVHRTFGTFEEYWRLANFAPGLSAKLESLAPEARDVLITFVRQRLGADQGTFQVTARANAIKGKLPS